MKLTQVEASWEESWPVNWDFVGIVFLPDGTPPEFILINGIKYEKEGG